MGIARSRALHVGVVGMDRISDDNENLIQINHLRPGSELVI
jgi:hypothetical protein